MTTPRTPGGPQPSGDAIAARLAELAPWFHNLHLPSGHETAPDHPLGDFPSSRWEQFSAYLPADLRGARALDVGCNAGHHSFALAARGADVLAIDSDAHHLAQAQWAAGQLDRGGRVRFRQMQVYDLTDLTETFDVVLFMGVLYHLRYPLLALDLVAERTAGTLVLQTLTMPGSGRGTTPADLATDERDALTGPGWPRAAFIEHRLAGDPATWWAPDDACVRAMARSAGLRIAAVPAHEIYLCEPGAPDPSFDELRESEVRAATGRG